MSTVEVQDIPGMIQKVRFCSNKYPILARDPIVPSVPSVPGVQVCLNPIVAVFIKAISLIDNLEFGISCKTYTG